MKYGLEFDENYILILPEKEDFKTPSGIILKKEETPNAKGVLVDSNKLEGILEGDPKLTTIDGLYDGNEVYYEKGKAELITINNVLHHVVHCDHVLFVVQ